MAAEHLRLKLSSLMEVGRLNRRDAAAALEAVGGDFLRAAAHVGVGLLPIVERAVGLPNRNNDCFWLASFQCLRHAPGLAAALCGCTHRRGQRPAVSLLDATANLLLALERVQPYDGRQGGALSRRSPELQDFILRCAAELPALDQTGSGGLQPLVVTNARRQRQQVRH